MKMVIGLIAALMAGAALAHDHSNSVNEAWLKEQRNDEGQVCCSGDDLWPADDIEWDVNAKQYRVKIGEEWLDVPTWALVLGAEQNGPHARLGRQRGRFPLCEMLHARDVVVIDGVGGGAARRLPRASPP
jgi:hypothetical protein